MKYSFPREIIKWIQTLNLEYSFKDIKRDLQNGYFIAEIFSRYFPEKISMHSYKNSNSKKFKNDNWNQLKKLFDKMNFVITQRIIEEITSGNIDTLIGKIDFDLILNN